MGKNELQIIKIAHLQNKREMQRFYFLGCQLGALPHALACRGFWGHLCDSQSAPEWATGWAGAHGESTWRRTPGLGVLLKAANL